MITSDFSSILSEFAAIGSGLSKMVEDKKIDLAIIPRVEALVNFSSDRESNWRQNKSVSPETAFTVYHTWRNLRLIAVKMRQRLYDAERMHQNPDTAVDGLKVLPSMLEVFTGMVAVEGKELSKYERTAALDRITELRNAAFHSDMLPSLDDELQETNVKDFVEAFDSFATNARQADETAESGS